MKKVFLAAVMALFFSANAFAGTLLTNFDDGTTDYSVYTPINDQFDFVWSVMAEYNLENNGTASSYGASGKVGVSTDMPLIGEADLVAGVSYSKRTDGNYALMVGQDVELVKNALVNLTDNVAIGASVTLLSYDAENKQIKLHGAVKPAISVTCEM